MSKSNDELRQIVTEALVGMISGVTGLVPPTGPGSIPDFIQAPIDRAVEKISSKLLVSVPEGWSVYRDSTSAIYVGVASGRLPGVWLYRDGSADERMLWAYFYEMLDGGASVITEQAGGDLAVHPRGVQSTSHPALIALDKQCRDDVARALGLRPTDERDFAWSYLLARVKEVVADAAKSASAIAEAKAWCDENGGTPAEFLSHQLLVKRCEVLGRPLTWREAIELTALTTSMPDDERDKLLALDDEPGGDA